MNKSYFVWVWCAALMLQSLICGAATRREQDIFYADSSEHVIRPISLPDAVSQILAKDSAVAACMEDNPSPHGQSLGSWFTASEVHLNGSDEADIVVLPVSAQGESYLCFRSAEGIAWFWVFRRTGPHYELVLKTAGLSLSILETRHNMYRDIRSEGVAGKFATTTMFRFNGGSYRPYRKKTMKIQ